MADFLSFTVADPNHRNIAMRPSEPLPDHVKDCMVFLKRITSLTVSGGTKKEFEITVQLSGAEDDNQSDNDSSSFTIKRSAKDLATIQSVVRDHCRQHVDLQKYQVAPCALCTQFNELEPLRVGTRDIVFKSVENIRASVQARLTNLIEGALVAPSASHLHCEGQVRVPSALAKFLLLASTRPSSETLGMTSLDNESLLSTAGFDHSRCWLPSVYCGVASMTPMHRMPTQKLFVVGHSV